MKVTSISSTLHINRVCHRELSVYFCYLCVQYFGCVAFYVMSLCFVLHRLRRMPVHSVLAFRLLIPSQRSTKCFWRFSIRVLRVSESSPFSLETCHTPAIVYPHSLFSVSLAHYQCPGYAWTLDITYYCAMLQTIWNHQTVQTIALYTLPKCKTTYIQHSI